MMNFSFAKKHMTLFIIAAMMVLNCSCMPSRRNPDSEEWFAQNYEDFINCYDYTVIMAYPYLEGDVHEPYQWVSEVIRKAINYAGAENTHKIVIKIQTYNWHAESWLPDTEIENYLNLIESFGLHSAMYPHK